jgi:hypothetical protein
MYRINQPLTNYQVTGAYMAGSLGLLISFTAFVSEMLSGKTRTKSKESKKRSKTVSINNWLVEK